MSFVIPVVFNKLEWSVCYCLTQLVYLMVEVYLHYYLRYNYMFRLSNNSHLQFVYESLESSYTIFNMEYVQLWCRAHWGMGLIFHQAKPR
jgi:hypothetical protein